MRLTPVARASFARGLSSDPICGVALGSTSLRRKRSSVTQNGLASSRAFLISFFVSLLFTSPHGATQRAGKYLRERQSFQSLPESSGVSLPLFGQRQIGEPRVLTRSAPGRLPMSRHINDAKFFAFANVHANPSLPHFCLWAC